MLNPIRLAMLGAVALALSACGSFDAATRNAPLQANALGAADRLVERDYDLSAIDVRVPAELVVSEANGYYPFADIVWRGDPVGNRHEQISALFQEAAARNMAAVDGNIPVVANLQLLRFHGVTERTRFSVGGIYNIIFRLTLTNAVTGAVIEEPRVIEVNLPAPGGGAAFALEQRGETEKVRVTAFLTKVLRDNLTGLRAL